MARAVGRDVPGLTPLAVRWLKGEVFHVAGSAGGDEGQLVSLTFGMDPGCPLSPGFYAVTARDPLAVAVEAARAVDPHADVLAFLDDPYLVGTLPAIRAGARAYTAA